MVHLVRKLLTTQDEKPRQVSIEELRVAARARARAAAQASPPDHLLIPSHRCPDFLRKAA